MKPDLDLPIGTKVRTLIGTEETRLTGTVVRPPKGTALPSFAVWVDFGSGPVGWMRSCLEKIEA